MPTLKPLLSMERYCTIRSPNLHGLKERKADLEGAEGLCKEQIIRANGDDTTLLREDSP